MMSVKVRRIVGDDSINAAARSCPMKPPLPVIRIFSSCAWLVAICYTEYLDRGVYRGYLGA